MKHFIAILIIGSAQYCAISPAEVQCVDHSLVDCLRTLSLLKGGIACVKNVKGEI